MNRSSQKQWLTNIRYRNMVNEKWTHTLSHTHTRAAVYIIRRFYAIVSSKRGEERIQ